MRRLGSPTSTRDFNIDPAAVAAVLSDRTKVLMPVHLYGQCADMDRLSDDGRARASCAVVEDAAQAHGARIGDRAAGSSGIGCFSLYATKNLTTGEGGLIIDQRRRPRRPAAGAAQPGHAAALPVRDGRATTTG